jgi:hypothetical protein
MRRSTHMKRCALLSRQPIREGSRETGRGSRAFAAKQLTLLLVKPDRSGQELDIIHPGQGLSYTELKLLSEFFPKLTFRSFEEILSWA